MTMATDGQGTSAVSGEDDLPDIIDVVMEMGRTPEKPTPKRPPLPFRSCQRRAYASDWKHFASWCRRQGFSLMRSDPQTVGLYITTLAFGRAAGTAAGEKKSVATIERRLSALTWNYAPQGQPLDRRIATSPP